MPEESPIPAQSVFVHVGLPKTGTTHLQATLAANRRELAAQGLLYPRAPRQPQHFLATLDFLRVRFGAISTEDVAGLWRQLVASVEAWPFRALISHELLARADSDQVARLIADFAPRDVHAVVSVRDLSRLLPAVWQERAKNRVVESWAEFRSGVATGPGAARPHDFWKLHDVEKVLAAWRPHVPDEHIHVITVPPPGADPSRLFSRLASVVGIDSTGFTVPDDAANASVGALELAVLREVNVVARERVDRATYQATVKRYLVPQVLARRPDQVKVTMPETDRPWVDAYTAHVGELLGDGRLDVVGELADLTPTNFSPVGTDSAQHAEFPPAAVITALAETVVDLLAKRADERATAPVHARQPLTPDETPGETADVSPDATTGVDGPRVRTRVRRAAGVLRRLARRAVSRLRS